MARYNEILVGRYNRFAQKLLGIKGGPPAAQLQSDIGLGIQLFHGRETFLHQGWTSWGKTGAQVGVTASIIQLRNPSNSGILAVIEKITIVNNSVATTDTYNITTGALLVDQATALSGQPRDTRQLSQASGCVYSQGSALAVSGNQLWSTTLAAAAPHDVIVEHPEHEFVLTPGFGLQVSTQLAAGTQRTAIWWRERPLEDGELVQ